MLHRAVITTTLAAGGTPVHDGDQSIVLHGVSWEQYETLRAMFDDRPGLRMTYLEGTLELMSPSRTHEKVKSLIGRLIEHYAFERDIPLYGYGSMTFKKEAKERGLEPDECYAVGEDMKEIPDIAIEVTLTSGGVDKLAVYAGLGVPEVWFWWEGRIAIHRLAGDAYEAQPRSQFLPDLDLVLLATLSGASDQVAALRAWHELIRNKA